MGDPSVCLLLHRILSLAVSSLEGLGPMEDLLVLAEQGLRAPHKSQAPPLQISIHTYALQFQGPVAP